MQVRIITWNIHKGIGGIDRRYDLNRVVELLRNVDPDVALLQEVTHGLPRAQSHDQASLLAEAMSMRHFAFHIEHRFAKGGYGNAILSRWPLSNVHHIDLTLGRRKRRGVLQARARVRLPDGHVRTLVIHNMHLGLAGSERARQLETYLASEPFGRLHWRTPLIVGGDFNDLWGTLGPRFLLPRAFVRTGPASNTFPAAMPIRPLDALFARGDLRITHARVVDYGLARQASDHLPLAVDLELIRTG